MKKKTTTRTFKYDPEGRITEETVTEVEEDIPTYPYRYPNPYFWYYPQYPYTVWTSAGSITTTNGTYTTFNNSINPPEKPKD